jgi:hypothetical protein
MRTSRRLLPLLGGILAALPLSARILSPEWNQEKNQKPEEPAEMQMVEGGFLILNTPKGWNRVEGAGLALFVKKGLNAADADVWIYVSGAPIGEGESAKDRKEYIQTDIADFRSRFANGVVREEEPLELPKTKTKVPVVSFESKQQHNAFEQVIYIEERNRVLTFVLSAKYKEGFDKTLLLFREFAKSYGGSVTLVPDSKQP